jgi:hypothetical protein
LEDEYTIVDRKCGCLVDAVENCFPPRRCNPSSQLIHIVLLASDNSGLLGNRTLSLGRHLGFSATRTYYVRLLAGSLLLSLLLELTLAVEPTSLFSGGSTVEILANPLLSRERS